MRKLNFLLIKFSLIGLLLISINSFAQVEVLNESLRSGSLPEGWAENSIIWETAAGGYARFSTIDAWLETPPLNLTDYSIVELIFSVAKYGGGDNGPLTVEVVVDGVVEQTFSSPTPTGSTYMTSGPTLITATGEEVIIRWSRQDSPSQKRFRDVIITGTIAGAAPPVISGIEQFPAADITSTTTVSVSAEVTEGDAAIDAVLLQWGTTSGDLPNNITMSLDTKGTYSTDTDIPAQPDGTTVFYVVYAEDVDGESVTSAEQSYIVRPAMTILPYLEPFDDDLGDCYVYSVSGPDREWNWNSGGWAQMNGFNTGDIEEDWLILPGIEMTGENVIMNFSTWWRHGADDDDNYLKLFYSTDYSGLGDPSSAAWTELSYLQPETDQTWATSLPQVMLIYPALPEPYGSVSNIVTSPETTGCGRWIISM